MRIESHGVLFPKCSSAWRAKKKDKADRRLSNWQRRQQDLFPHYVVRQHVGVNSQGRIHEVVGHCFSAADRDFLVPLLRETDQLISPLHLA